MADLLTPDDLSRDDDGAPLRYLSTFRCDDCGETWTDQWSCACDDECPSCGKDFSPDETEDLLAPFYAANPDIQDPADD